MKRGQRPELMWGFGLCDQDADTIREASGEGFHLRIFAPGEEPGADDTKNETPFLIWVGKEAWDGMDGERRSFYEQFEESKKVLVLPKDAAELEFESVVVEGFLTSVRTPVSKQKVQDVLFRASEIDNLYDDIFRMTREIFLERELLSRKTDQLLFLNQILSRAAESLDTTTIINRAREDMNLLFEVSAVQAVLWTPGDGDAIEAELLLDPHAKDQSRESWIEYLLENAARLAATPVRGYHVETLETAEDQPRAPLAPPASDTTVLLPLRTGFEYFGCLALTAQQKPNLAKDHIQTMRAAVNHLALALKNAQLYSQVKHRADYDGLTRIHNRHSFDERLLEELKRHQRYRHPLSLLLLDLDHFKAINDDHGHQAGDKVLKEIGRILNSTLRVSDFAARYGGEEFVVLLPQTCEEEAWLLADRLRRKIAGHSFSHRQRPFRVTASIGVASMSPGSLRKVGDLIQEADDALYQAKSGGRNMVCLSRNCGRETAIHQ